jgi:hypothetical protein
MSLGGYPTEVEALISPMSHLVNDEDCSWIERVGGALT